MKREQSGKEVYLTEKGMYQGMADRKPAREYKDRIFRMIFKEKREFLELYNAMNESHYTNAGDLIVTTLENAIYLNMKNDVSFMLYDQLTLYEHQSSRNPNMPLRDLLYVASIYSGIVRDENLFSSSLVKIPEPKFVVFYNGTETMEERLELRLSDAYLTHTDTPELELKVTVLNINSGYNEELLQKCKTLHEYMILVNKIRMYSQGVSFEEAIELAVEECIQENVLADFLRKNRSEVVKVSIFEYNEELHIKQEREQAWKEGANAILKAKVGKKLQKGKTVAEIAEELEESVENIEHIIKSLE